MQMQYLATYLISNDYDDDKQAAINYNGNVDIGHVVYLNS